MTDRISPEATGEEIIQNFDTIYTTNEIKICKVALPMLGKDIQALAALLIKAMELKYCYFLYTQTQIHSLGIEMGYFKVFLEQAKPYCSRAQKELFQKMENIYTMTKSFDQIKELFDFADPSVFNQFEGFADLLLHNPAASSSTDTDATRHKKNNPSIESLFQNTFNKHQKEIYEKFRKEYS